MLTFKNKEEEEFWKQVVIAQLHRVVVVRATEADWAVEKLRERQPVQQFPEIKAINQEKK